MGKAIDDFVDELKKEILLETKEAYGEKAYERWCHPLYMGLLEDPDGQAYVRGPCGDPMAVFLRFEGDCVKEASFQTEGCGASAVCGSFAAELAIGKNPDEIMQITGETILESLGGLPMDEVPSAFHAAQTLHEALRDHMAKRSGGEKEGEPSGRED
ncbi:MAG: iron-sulfur cluster assembly scaffold protein [Pseudomonadota bacterium]